MKVDYDQKFEQQCKEFNFKFTCENCVHYSLSKKTCAHEYPNGEHKSDHYSPDNPPESILFCKQFELA